MQDANQTLTMISGRPGDNLTVQVLQALRTIQAGARVTVLLLSAPPAPAAVVLKTPS